MNDDVLGRATRALRDTTQEVDAPGERRRLHLVASAARSRRRARMRRLVALPIALSMMVAGTWAGATGRLSRLAASLSSTLTSSPPAGSQADAHGQEPSRTLRGPKHEPAPPAMETARAAIPEAPAAVEAPRAAITEPPATASTAIAEPAAQAPRVAIAEPAQPSRAAAPRIAKAPEAAPTVARAVETPAARVSPEPANAQPVAVAGSPVDPPSDARALVPAVPDLDALYQAAHRAHFGGQAPAIALAAWDRYLAAAPRGPMVLEARYNRAIALYRLGRKADAAAALRPFAEGDYGSYRRDEAKALLEAR
ncbi:Hypothetical protein A7982_01947 [Minicystis rosea]|nr:Hypothetical protein A7982_01947 [Minicystis rosea]